LCNWFIDSPIEHDMQLLFIYQCYAMSASHILCSFAHIKDIGNKPMVFLSNGRRVVEHDDFALY
jgi:hypothetical protein